MIAYAVDALQIFLLLAILVYIVYMIGSKR